MLFSFLHLVPMFVAARMRVEPCDALLARLDARMGVEVPDVLKVMDELPRLNQFLKVCYDTLLFLVTLAIMIPPMCGKMRAAKEYAIATLASALVSIPLFAAFQAVGPWGKFAASDADVDEPTLVVATDTGITAALGLLRGRAFARRLAGTTLLWFATSDDDFVTESFVRERLPAACASFRVERFPAVGHPERPLVARHWLARTDRPARAFLAGDGDVTTALTEALLAAGLGASAIAVECFFNNPAKRAAV